MNDNVVPFSSENTDGPAILTENPPPASSGCGFKISRAKLAEILATIKWSVPAKATIPVLSNVLISFADGRLALSGTNIDAHSIIETDVVSRSGGSVTVDARTFSQIVAKLSGEDITVDVRGTSIVVSDGQNETRLDGIPASEFVPVPSAEYVSEFVMSGGQLKVAMSAAIPFASHDHTRYILNSVYMDFAKKALVATDGRRLVVVDAPALSVASTSGVILPIQAAETLAGTLPEAAMVSVALAKSGRYVKFNVAMGTTVYTYISKLVDGNYPNYTQVIPRESPRFSCRVKRQEIGSMLERLLVICNGDKPCVKFNFTLTEVQASAIRSGVGAGDESVLIDGEGTEDGVKVAINPLFILQAAAAWVDDRIEIRLKDDVSPVTLHGEGKLAVVMPVRLE